MAIDDKHMPLELGVDDGLDAAYPHALAARVRQPDPIHQDFDLQAVQSLHGISKHELDRAGT